MLLNGVLHHESLHSNRPPGIKDRQLHGASLGISAPGEKGLCINQSLQNARPQSIGVRILAIRCTHAGIGMGFKTQKTRLERHKRFTAVVDHHIAPGTTHPISEGQEAIVWVVAFSDEVVRFS